MTLATGGLTFGRGGTAIGEVAALSFAPGEVFCLLGPNGGGKTTLLKTLAGLLPPVSGDVTFAGVPLGALSAGERARAIGFVPQAAPATFAYSALDIVVMGRAARVRPFALPSRADLDAALAALAAFGLEPLAARPFPQLSGGERQMVLIARALAQEAAVLVLDEPTASLDLANQMEVLAALARLARDGIAVIFSTHDPGHGFTCASRAGLLGGGRLRAVGPPAEAITPRTLGALYGIEVDVVYEPRAGRHVCVPAFSKFDRRFP